MIAKNISARKTNFTFLSKIQKKKIFFFEENATENKKTIWNEFVEKSDAAVRDAIKICLI